MAIPDPSQEILLDDATPGMLLAEAVLDRAGTRLISPGVELTEKTIQTLKQRGVLHISVVVTTTEQVGGLPSEEKLRRLDVLFKNSLDSEPNRLLREYLRRYRMMQ